MLNLGLCYQQDGFSLREANYILQRKSREGLNNIAVDREEIFHFAFCTMPKISKEAAIAFLAIYLTSVESYLWHTEIGDDINGEPLDKGRYRPEDIWLVRYSKMPSEDVSDYLDMISQLFDTNVVNGFKELEEAGIVRIGEDNFDEYPAVMLFLGIYSAIYAGDDDVLDPMQPDSEEIESLYPDGGVAISLEP